jgi:hypothetical protein
MVSETANGYLRFPSKSLPIRSSCGLGCSNGWIMALLQLYFSNRIAEVAELPHFLFGEWVPEVH